ncbi:hypothetical protein [Prevotella sp. Rep29]|jgi:hypothetical protein|uniref:hypothetical protein n=1 Tax=Prevotella sp. Rep29 TaxID=2691580 RepID=UPI001C6EC794|nr:hypothetical protein [Prevotella sp. Rep29]QYR09819.1 hypothetical protein GRF55_01210 [Prevotella sp. Rep29]
MQLNKSALKNYHGGVVFLLNVFLIYNLYHLLVYDISPCFAGKAADVMPEICRHILFATACILVLKAKKAGIFLWLAAICLPECIALFTNDNYTIGSYSLIFLITDYIIIPGLFFSLLKKNGKDGWMVLFGKRQQDENDSRQNGERQ